MATLKQKSPVDQNHKFHNAPVLYPRMHNSEEECAHLCSEWCIVVYGTCITGVVKFVSCDDAAVWPHLHSRFPWLLIVQPCTFTIAVVLWAQQSRRTDLWQALRPTLVYVSVWGQRQSVAGLHIGSHQNPGKHRLATGPWLKKNYWCSRVVCPHCSGGTPTRLYLLALFYSRKFVKN